MELAYTSAERLSAHPINTVCSFRQKVSKTGRSSISTVDTIGSTSADGLISRILRFKASTLYSPTSEIEHWCRHKLWYSKMSLSTRTNLPIPVRASSNATRLPTEPHPKINAHLLCSISDSKMPVFREKMFWNRLYFWKAYSSPLNWNRSFSASHHPIKVLDCISFGFVAKISPKRIVAYCLLSSSEKTLNTLDFAKCFPQSSPIYFFSNRASGKNTIFFGLTPIKFNDPHLLSIGILNRHP